jgi:HAD-superfamily phosphatase, subfamily IIIC/FkbH-like domain
MKELEYPFDIEYILEKKKSIKRRLLNENKNFIEKNIAILGGSTTSNIRVILELFLLNHGIKPSFYESEYNQYYQDAVYPNAELEDFHPDIIYIYTTNRNVTCYPDMSDTKETIEKLIQDEFYKFQSIWLHLEETYHCPIIQNNFEMPLYRLLGNKDASDIHGAVNFLTRLNMEFYSYSQTHENFYICDINYISADYGLSKWSEELYWHLYKYALNVSAIPYLVFNVANIIKSIYGKNKKGLVLDLDNTLWGGVIGDEGVDNIVLGPEEAEGQAYSEFQLYLKKLKQLGIILNIDSKNDYDNAVSGLNHPYSVLKPDDFIEIRANWEPKDQNFREIASYLDLLPESLVFVDDNPAERHIVREQILGVSAPELETVTSYTHTIDRSGFFEITLFSRDDLKRNVMYKENAERAKLQSSFRDYKEYLISLEMNGVIKEFEPIYMTRIAQLSNKSNQFNLTTRRYTQGDIENIANNENYITLYGKLNDRFGDNGVVSVVIGNIIGSDCHIELWIMSCRVLKRDMEFAMMDELVRRCKDRKIQRIYGYYYPTKKNSIVLDFYALQGFKKIDEDDNGNTKWLYEVPNEYVKKNNVINVINS